MNLQGKSILITGASGFIGSFLVDYALEAGAEVWAGVRPTSSRRYLRDPRIRFIELDLGSDSALVRQLTAQREQYGAWDYVIHAAGATKCTRPDDFHRINTLGTERLARLLLGCNALRGRFVFISSLSVFGAVREEAVPAAEAGGPGLHYAPVTGHDTPRPNTAYGRSKLQAEEALAAMPGLDYVVLRPSGVYGPRERDYFLMARSIARHVDFAVGRRPQEITFVYVRDVCTAALTALTRGERGRAYFLTDGHVYTSRAFSDLLQAEMGVARVVHVTAPLWVLRAVCAVSGWLARRRGTASTLNMDKYHIMRQRNWQCDISPARRELGYEPRYALAEGVRETVAWYKKEQWL